MFPSYRNQSIDVHCKSIDWFLYAGSIGMKKVNCLNLKGEKLSTRSRFRLRPLRDHKFKHSFQDCLNTISTRGFKAETTAHHLLQFLNNLYQRKTFLDNIASVLPNNLE